METTTPQLDALQVRRIERACFDGLLLTAFSYGALLMVMTQFVQVLVMRPKRGRVFWGMIVYTACLLLLSTTAVGGRFKFAEMMYVEHKEFPAGYLMYYFTFMDRWENVLNQICMQLLPWVSDVLMIYRLFVLWNYQWWVIACPILLHLCRMAFSIPLIIIITNAQNPEWLARLQTYTTIYYSLSLALNLLFTGLIAFRLWMLRPMIEQTMGAQSVYYTSASTTMVESSAVFTLWSIVHFVLLMREHWSAEIFQQPYIYLNAICRMLIILRIAQNRAWCRDTVAATSAGVLDWQVSSSHSIPLHDAQSGGSQNDCFTKLPKKFRERDGGL